MIPRRFKSPVTPATVEEIRDWAINIVVDNDIDSYDGMQMSMAITLSGMLEQPLAYLRDVGTDEDPCYVPCSKGDPGAIPVFAVEE